MIWKNLNLTKIKKIYKLIAANRYRFVSVAQRYTEDKTTIDDVIQEQMLYFMQMNKQTLIDIYDKDGLEGLVKYGAVAIHRAITSKRSSYYYKYRKYYTNLSNAHYTFKPNYNKAIKQSYEESLYSQAVYYPDEKEYKDQLLEKVEKELGNMYWYDKKVFEVYYKEGHTLDSLAKKTGISRNSLFSTLKKVRTKLKEILDDDIFCNE